jgi:hypothetical protein
LHMAVVIHQIRPIAGSAWQHLDLFNTSPWPQRQWDAVSRAWASVPETGVFLAPWPYSSLWPCPRDFTTEPQPFVVLDETAHIKRLVWWGLINMRPLFFLSWRNQTVWEDKTDKPVGYLTKWHRQYTFYKCG